MSGFFKIQEIESSPRVTESSVLENAIEVLNLF